MRILKGRFVKERASRRKGKGFEHTDAVPTPGVHKQRTQCCIMCGDTDHDLKGCPIVPQGITADERSRLIQAKKYDWHERAQKIVERVFQRQHQPPQYSPPPTSHDMCNLSMVSSSLVFQLPHSSPQLGFCNPPTQNSVM